MKENTDELWKVFTDNIIKAKDMPLKQTLVKRKENRKVDTAIQRALTYGVPIINHGRSRTFI